MNKIKTIIPTKSLMNSFHSIINIFFQMIDFDGGETRLNSGEFSMYHKVEPDQWEMLETMIRGKTGKDKAKM